MSPTANEIMDIYYATPAALRKHSHWLMSKETLEQIQQLPEVKPHAPFAQGPGTMVGKPIQIEPDAVGITLVPECICELCDISELRGPKFVRGLSNGCAIHPPSEYELRVIAEREAYAAAVEAAQREARERS